MEDKKPPYVSDDFQIGPDGAYEHEDKKYNLKLKYTQEKGISSYLARDWSSLVEVEKLAKEQFKYVGDEGLFPNHTDKDIWMSGFVAAMEWISNQTNK